MKRSLEFKIYIGVPRVRNAMPPPLPHASTPGGARACPPACLRGGKDTLHCPAAQAQDTGHRSTAAEEEAPEAD